MALHDETHFLVMEIDIEMKSQVVCSIMRTPYKDILCTRVCNTNQQFSFLVTTMNFK